MIFPFFVCFFFIEKKNDQQQSLKITIIITINISNSKSKKTKEKKKMKKTIEINYNSIKLAGSSKFKDDNNKQQQSKSVSTLEKPKKIIFKSKAVASAPAVDVKKSPTKSSPSKRKLSSSPNNNTNTNKQQPASNGESGNRRLRLKRAHSDDDDDDDDDNDDIFKFSASKSANKSSTSNSQQHQPQQQQEEEAKPTTTTTTSPIKSSPISEKRSKQSPPEPSSRSTRSAKNSPVSSQSPINESKKKASNHHRYDLKELDDDDDDLVKFNFKKPSIASTSTTSTSTLTTITTTTTTTTVTNGFKRKIFSERSHESIKLKTQSIDFNYEDSNAQIEAATTSQNSNSSSDDVFNRESNLLNQAILVDDIDLEMAKRSKKANIEITAKIATTNGNRKAIGLFEDSDREEDDSMESKKVKSRDDDDDEYFLLNTRKAYECEELGETQAFADDLFYLMDGLSDKFSTSQRCLSAIKLAEQCLSSEFRMHLRSSHGTLNKIFMLLADSPNEPSLALCTACILFALSRDKLTIEMDKSILQLLMSIINNKKKPDLATESKTSASASVPTKSKIFKSSSMNMTSSKELYEKTLERCKSLCDKLISDSIEKVATVNEAEKTMVVDDGNEVPVPEQFDIDTSELSAQMLAMECLLNFTINRRASDWLKDELRLLGAFDNIVDCLNELSAQLKQSEKRKRANNKRGKASFADYYAIKKLTRCLKLFENITQATVFGSSYENLLVDSCGDEQITSTTSPLSSSIDDDDSLSAKALALTSTKQPLTKSQSTNSNSSTVKKHLSVKELKTMFTNHNYLLDLHLLDTLNDSLLTFYHELIQINDPSSVKSTLITNGIKEIFLLLINLSHANFECTKHLLSNRRLIDLMFIFLSKIVGYLSEADRFDILILAIIVLINICVIKFNLSKTTTSTTMSKIKLDASSIILNRIDLAAYNLDPSGVIRSLDIVLSLYKTKENLVSLAETDQENELMQLNEQISSQNVENINLTVMNSISKAGKHMEEHIIAAHSAIILCYMLMDLKRDDEEASDAAESTRQEFQAVKAQMVDKSFKNMAEIIRKFLTFMKIMKVSGFSADEHLEELIDFLEHS